MLLHAVWGLQVTISTFTFGMSQTYVALIYYIAYSVILLLNVFVICCRRIMEKT